MPDTIDILIQSRFSGQGVTQAQQAYQRLDAAQQQLAKAQASAAQSGQKSTAEITKAAAAVSKAERDVLSLAQAEFRLQAATGNLAAGQQTLATAISRVDATSAGATRALTTLAQSEQKASAGGAGLAALPRTIDGITGPAARAAIAITGIGSAMALASKGVELAQIGAQSMAARESFDGLAMSAKTTGQTLLTSLRAAAAGTISDTKLMISANTGLLLVGDKIASALPKLVEIARASARATGQEVDFLFNSLVLGISRGSPKIIDNAGITLDAAGAMETYAKSIGKTVDQLTNQEQQQATLNAVMATGQGFIEKIGTSTDGAAVSFAQLKASSENATASVGTLIAKLLQVPAKVTSEILIKVSGGIDQLNDFDAKLQAASEAAYSGAQSYDDYAKRVAFANEQLAPFKANIASLSEPTYQYAQALQASGVSAEEAFNKALALGTAIDNTAQSQGYLWERTNMSGEAISALGERMLTLAGTSDSNRAAVESLSASFNAGGITADQLQAAIATLEARTIASAEAASYDAIEQAHLTATHQTAAGAALEAEAAHRATTASLVEQIAQSQQSALATQQLAQMQATLAGLGGQVANGLMTAGNAALVLANQYGVAYSEALKLINAQATIAGTKARVQQAQDFRAGERSGGEFSSAAEQARVTQQRIQQARVEQQIAQLHETDAQRLKRLRGEMAAMAPYDERRVATEREIMQLTKPKGGGGRGGGAASPKLSAQQQLGNALLSDADKTANQLEDLDLKHQKKLLEIDQQANEKRLAAQRAFSQAMADSNASFYDSLASVGSSGDKKADQALRQQLSARYEAAAQEADRIAKEKGADAGQAYMDAQTKAIQKEGEIQDKINKAKQEKDMDTAKYYEGVLALQKKADDQRIADVVSQGSAIENERQKQIGAENQAYTEAQGNIMVASSRAADAKITNAQRSGKAIDEENAKLQHQVELYGQLGSMPTPRAPAGGGPVPGRASGGPVSAGQSYLVGESGPELVTFGASGMVMNANSTQQLLSGGGGVPTGAAGMDSIIWAILNGTRNQKAQISALKQYLAIVEQAATIINTIAQIRSTLATPQPLLRVADMLRIAQDAAMVTTILADTIVPATRLQANQLKGYTEMIKISVDSLKDVTDLRKNMAEPQSPLTEEIIRKLANEVQMVTRILMELLIPTGRQAHDALEYYADVSSKGVSILKNMIELRASLKDLKGPLDERVIRALADEARRVARIVMAVLVPTSEALAKEMNNYADSVSHSVGIVKDVADLRSASKDLGSPISEADIRRVAAEAVRITRLMRGYLLPTTEAQGKTAGDYADVVSKSIGILKDTLDLPGKLFSDYTSPTDTQIRRVVTDANRITRQIAAAAKTYDTAGLTAAKAYTEALSGTFGAIKDGLLAVEALNSGDFEIKAGALERFGRSAARSLSEVRRLAAQAAAIPPANLSALERATAALTAYAEALIKIAAAPPLPPNPFGSGLAPLINGGGRGGSPFAMNTSNQHTYGPMTVHLHLPPNVDAPMLDMTIRRLEQRTSMRRAVG